MAFDHSDADDWILVSLLSAPATWVGLLVVILIGVAVYSCAHANERECAKLHCASGQQPKLLQHECLCVERAQP